MAVDGARSLVGLVGAVYLVERDLTGQGALLVERAINGAPLMAPSLFTNMGALGLIVLLDPNALYPKADVSLQHLQVTVNWKKELEVSRILFNKY